METELSLDALVDEGLDIGSKYDFLTRDNPVFDPDDEEPEQ